MSENRTITCDVCGIEIETPLPDPWRALPGSAPSTRYDICRYDQTGYYDRLDICSTTCLSAVALSDAGSLAKAECVASHQPAETRRRRWWQRGGRP